MSMLVDVDAPPALDTTILKALAEPQRATIVRALATEELCVCHLVEVLRIDQPLVSHHLRVLREAGLVTSERYRYWTYYRLVPGAVAAVAAELSALAERAPEPGRRRRPCC